MINTQQIAVGGAIFNDKQELLFVRRALEDDFMPGSWELPGGGTDFGETPQVGLQREIQEECGLTITVGSPITTAEYYLENKNEKIQRIEIVYYCELDLAAQTVTLSHEHDAYTWKKITEISDLEMTPFMTSIVEAVLDFAKRKNSS